MLGFLTMVASPIVELEHGLQGTMASVVAAHWGLVAPSSVQSLSHVQLFGTPWSSMPGFPVHHQLLELAQTHVHWVSDAIQASHPLSSPFPPAFNLSHHQGLVQRVGSSHQVAEVLEFQLQHQSFQWIFRTDLVEGWLVWSPCIRGTHNSLLQHHSSKASILRRSAFFRVQLSHPYMTTGKTIALTRRTFAGKVVSLLFNMLSRLLICPENPRDGGVQWAAIYGVTQSRTLLKRLSSSSSMLLIAFLPRSKHLLISWLQSPSAVILELSKIASHCFLCFPTYLPWSDGTGCHDLVAPWYFLCSWSSRTRVWTCVSCIGRQILNHWTTREVC